MRNQHQQVEHRGARTYLAALPILAPTIAERNGVELRFDNEALGCTDGKVIRLIPPPQLAPDAPQEAVERLVTLYRGLLQHEVGHIRKTDLEDVVEVIRKDKNAMLVKDLANAIEDPRMENAHGKDYRGADGDMRRLSKLLIAEGKDCAVPEDAPPRAIVAMFLNHKLRALLREQEEYVAIADEDERVARKVLGDRSVTRILATLATALPNLDSGLASVRIAQRIAGILDEEAQDPPPEPEQSPHDEEQPESAGQDQAQAGGQAQQDPDASPGPATQAQRQAIAQAMDQSQPDGFKDASQMASEAIGEQIQQMVDQGQAEHGEAIEQIAPPGPGAGDGQAPLTHDEPVDPSKVASQSARIRTRLAQYLQTETMEEDWVGKRGRRIDRNSLHRARLGDGRVFTTRTENRGVDTALFLLIDSSGSMNGTPIQIARESALAIAMATDLLPDVSVAAGTFPSFEMLQAFGASTRRCVPHYGIGACGGTPTAEAIVWAGKQLLARTEARRILVVVTDGEPNDTAAAQQAIRAMRALEMDVIGIGIGGCGDRIEQLFGTATAIESIAQLPTTLFGILEQTLREQLAA